MGDKRSRWRWRWKICWLLQQLPSLNILIRMTKSSFSSALVLALLAATSLCFDLVGSWQFTPNAQASQSISNALTFQFDRNVDSSGRISSKLFVYDCFISQFLYQVKDNKISFNFQTSTLLADSCSLSVINQLRSMIQKVFSFQIKYDMLSLVSLNGDVVFALVRQKIDFSKIMVGAWVLSSAQQTAKHPARINGSCINLCQDQGQFKYSVQTVNGSYPRLQTQIVANNLCADLSFLNSLSKVSLFQVASNRSQLTFFDVNLKYSFTMNKIGSINADEPLYTAPVVATSSIVSTPATPKQTIPSSPAANTNTINTVTIIPTTSAVQPSASPTTAPVTAQSQPIATLMTPARYQTSTSVSAQSQPSSSSTSQFSFDFSSNQFSGFFSSSPLFSSVSAESSPTQTAPSVGVSSVDQNQPIINLSDDSFFSGFGSLTQQVTSIAQDASSSTSNAISAPIAPIAPTIANITSQGIGSGSAISVPISQSVLSNKWLLTWLNGINSLSPDFTHVYLIFTTSRIILYCPCNTFYTAYQFQGNTLTGLKWQGTKNQCQVNHDNLITNFIFYSTAVRQSGQSIIFYYNSKAKMAEFRPYY